MWLSAHSRPIHTPCHYDGASNFIAQLRGRKRIVLFSPRDSSTSRRTNTGSAGKDKTDVVGTSDELNA